MSTEMKEYLKYYIGCEAVFDNRKWLIDFYDVRQNIVRLRRTDDGYPKYNEVWPNEMKIVLRRLSSITEEEVQEIAKMEGLVNANAEKYKAWWQLQDDSYTIRICFWGEIELMKDGRICRLGKQFPITHYLLSRGFWLFGDEAFEKGLIIEKK